jgi:hypothetical protein
MYKLTRAYNSVRTAYRRIDHPEIKRSDLVIDIGSGGQPNPRADVLCDGIESNTERSDTLKIDRPFVWANVDHLPFKEKAFNYSILSHVLEHVHKPAETLDEVQRISKAGYIETPNSFYEFAVSHLYHLSRCTVIDGKLLVTFKKQWDERLGGDRSDIDYDANNCFMILNSLNAIATLTRYDWQGSINYEVRGHGPFVKPVEQLQDWHEDTSRSFLRRTVIRLIYWLKRPRRKLVIEDLIVCPRCKWSLKIENEATLLPRRPDGHPAQTEPAKAICFSCGSSYGKYKGYWDLRV